MAQSYVRLDWITTGPSFWKTKVLVAAATDSLVVPTGQPPEKSSEDVQSQVVLTESTISILKNVMLRFA